MIQIPDSFMGRKIEGAMERVLKTQPSKQDPATLTPAQVSSSGDYWRIPVNYRNGLYTADLAKSLLDNGKEKTQDEWAGYRKIVEPAGEFYTGDMPLYFSICSAFANANGKDAEEARDFLKKQMRERWLMTLTKIKYNPKSNDEVIHNINQPSMQSFKTDFVGRDGWIKDVAGANVLEALLGEGDIGKINQVFQKINGTDAYIWRINSKPQSAIDRVAGFLAYSGRAYLYCYRDASGRYASLGVRLVREAPKKT